MGTRQLLIEKILRPEEFYFFMYSEMGVMYFRNEKQISEEEYMMSDRIKVSKIEMPLFFDAAVKKQYNLKTFEDVNN